MSTKYQTTNRCYLIDHHSPQPPAVTLENLNIEEYGHFFETANIDSLMVYCKDHWGVTYYNSQVPGSQKHMGIEGDWISQISKLLKEMKIEFVAYYCIEYDEGAARNHPEWRVRKADGAPLIRDDEFAKWSLCCYQTGYRQYALSQMEEIIENYHPDSLFLDIFGASLCYCDTCRAKFLNQFGYPMPESEEGISRHRLDIITFLDNHSREFLKEIKQLLKNLDSSLAITVNFSCHYPKRFRDMLDYQFSEPLLKDNWFSSAYARDTAIGQYPILVPGEASQVYNYDSVEEYVCDLCAILAQGCRVGMYSGSQHIDGTLDYEEARRLGVVFAEIKKMEPYLEGRRPVKSIGILQSDQSMAINLDTLLPDAILRMKHHNRHQDAVLGAMQLCEHEKLPYMVLPEESLTKELLSEFDMILLPEVFIIPPSLCLLLEDYVQSGGALIASGQCGLYSEEGMLLPQSSIHSLLGAGCVSVNRDYEKNRWSAYLKSDGTKFTGLLSCTTPPVSEYFVETQIAPEENVPPSQFTAKNRMEDRMPKMLLEFIRPCVACTSSEWVNWWSPPPGEATGFPALLNNRFGKGLVYYCCFDFFTMAASEKYAYTHELFSDLVNMSGITPTLRNQVANSGLVRTAYFETSQTYIIHQLSMLPKLTHGETVPLDGGKLILPIAIQNAQIVYPEAKTLDIKKEGAFTYIELPEFRLQQIIILSK